MKLSENHWFNKCRPVDEEAKPATAPAPLPLPSRPELLVALLEEAKGLLKDMVGIGKTALEWATEFEVGPDRHSAVPSRGRRQPWTLVPLLYEGLARYLSWSTFQNLGRIQSLQLILRSHSGDNLEAVDGRGKLSVLGVLLSRTFVDISHIHRDLLTKLDAIPVSASSEDDSRRWEQIEQLVADLPAKLSSVLSSIQPPGPSVSPNSEPAFPAAEPRCRLKVNWSNQTVEIDGMAQHLEFEQLAFLDALIEVSQGRHYTIERKPYYSLSFLKSISSKLSDVNRADRLIDSMPPNVARFVESKNNVGYRLTAEAWEVSEHNTS